MRRSHGLPGVMVMASALVACAVLPGPTLDTTVREGPCTLVLVQDGEERTPPYRVAMSAPDPGRFDRPVMYDPAGWGGQVSMTITFPDGKVEVSGVDAPSFNEGNVLQGFQEPGIFRLTFDDGHCRQELEVEVVAPAD